MGPDGTATCIRQQAGSPKRHSSGKDSPDSAGKETAQECPDRVSGEHNASHICSSTEEHAAEVNWPGPVLFVEHRP